MHDCLLQKPCCASIIIVFPSKKVTNLLHNIVSINLSITDVRLIGM